MTMVVLFKLTGFKLVTWYGKIDDLWEKSHLNFRVSRLVEFELRCQPPDGR